VIKEGNNIVKIGNSTKDKNNQFKAVAYPQLKTTRCW